MENGMNKRLEDLLSKELLKKIDLNDLLHKEVVVEEKKPCPFLIVMAIIGCISVVAAIAYAVYYFFFPLPEEYYDDEDDEDIEAGTAEE